MFEINKENDQMIAYYELHKHEKGKSLKQLSMELGMQPNLTFDDLKSMSVDDLSNIDIAEHKELTDDMLKYMTSRFLGSLTDEEIESALVNMDTGIYDESGNLIGDKCEEDDAYEWEE